MSHHTNDAHTTDCMSEWAESRRHLMTQDTIAANHRLHMQDVAEHIAALHGWAKHHAAEIKAERERLAH